MVTVICFPLYNYSNLSSVQAFQSVKMQPKFSKGDNYCGWFHSGVKLEPHRQQDCPATELLMSEICTVQQIPLHPPQNESPSENLGRYSTARHHHCDVGEAGKDGRGVPASTLLITTTNRTRAAPPQNTEQLLLKEDIFFPEVRQTPELAG